jgi:adenylosuccinate lyase
MDWQETFHTLNALSALDGRYHAVCAPLQGIFSELALMRFRVMVEIRWLRFLSKELKLFPLADVPFREMEDMCRVFSYDMAVRIKTIENGIKHDVKAVEYFVKEILEERGLGDIREWVHFGCTSEDINNTAYALMIKEGMRLLAGSAQEVLGRLEISAKQYKSLAMMSRTHGQPATPTTMGKEFLNFAWRLRKEVSILEGINVEAKFNGATGNFNAHHFVFPDIDWIQASRSFLKDALDLEPLLWTTQINPYNYVAEILHSLCRMSSIIIDLDRDMWGYISLGYLKQKNVAHEVGSSTMPHKVNPIDFENSEGNMGMAIALLQHMAVKLLNSRFQRDLTDSTVLRNLGAAFGYVLVGLSNACRGLERIEAHDKAILRDLEENWELLAEPLQMTMRVYGEPDPYERLKNLTRGEEVSREKMADFIDSLEKVPSEIKEKMKALSPSIYIGMAEKLVGHYFQEKLSKKMDAASGAV